MIISWSTWTDLRSAWNLDADSGLASTTGEAAGRGVIALVSFEWMNMPSSSILSRSISSPPKLSSSLESSSEASWMALKSESVLSPLVRLGVPLLGKSKKGKRELPACRGGTTGPRLAKAAILLPRGEGVGGWVVAARALFDLGLVGAAALVGGAARGLPKRSKLEKADLLSRGDEAEKSLLL